MKIKIRFSKENYGKYYETIVEAENEKEAFLLARDEAEQKGIKLPKECWVRTTLIANK